MELDLMYQIYQASSALLLGLAAGLYYDVLKLVRRAGKRASGGTALFDLLFWLGLALALFVQTMTMGRGMVRIFMLVTNALGALLYFLTLSETALFLLEKILYFILVITAPVYKICAKGKNVVRKEKEVFKNWIKHYIMKYIHLHNPKRCKKKRTERGEQIAQKSKHIYQTSCVGGGRLRGVQSDRSPRADRKRKRGQNSPLRGRGRADLGKRGLRK